MNESKSSPFRPVNIASWDVCVEHSPDGSIYMRPVQKPADYPTRLTDSTNGQSVSLHAYFSRNETMKASGVR